MIDQLPYLIRLCDDSSTRVRERVQDALREILDLEAEIERLDLPLSSSQQQALQPIFEFQRDAHVRLVNLVEAASYSHSARHDTPQERPQWLDWLDEKDEWRRLETALDSVARWLDFDSGAALGQAPPSISQTLDDLADEYEKTGLERNADSLARWLFASRRLGGVPSGDFYNPLNSHLVHVVRRGRGLPISLCAVFMLVAHRFDIEVSGCNFPGHFLVCALEDAEEVFYDPYDGGRRLTPLEVRAIRKAAPDATNRVARAEEIAARFLRNLATAYEYGGDRTKSHFMLQLLAELEAAS
jgi:regulator of sirC expression with transglutaminase-like and TPR domain